MARLASSPVSRSLRSNSATAAALESFICLSFGGRVAADPARPAAVERSTSFGAAAPIRRDQLAGLSRAGALAAGAATGGFTLPVSLMAIVGRPVACDGHAMR